MSRWSRRSATVYRLSDNRAIEDTVAARWPHLKHSMGAVLDDPGQRPLVSAEHRAILRLVLGGDAAGTERRPPHRPCRQRNRTPAQPIVLVNERRPRCR
jgi:hypothetical protein